MFNFIFDCRLVFIFLSVNNASHMIQFQMDKIKQFHFDIHFAYIESEVSGKPLHHYCRSSEIAQFYFFYDESYKLWFNSNSKQTRSTPIWSHISLHYLRSFDILILFESMNFYWSIPFLLFCDIFLPHQFRFWSLSLSLCV